jgi:hypothetical protein
LIAFPVVLGLVRSDRFAETEIGVLSFAD